MIPLKIRPVCVGRDRPAAFLWVTLIVAIYSEHNGRASGSSAQTSAPAGRASHLSIAAQKRPSLEGLPITASCKLDVQETTEPGHTVFIDS